MRTIPVNIAQKTPFHFKHIVKILIIALLIITTSCNQKPTTETQKVIHKNTKLVYYLVGLPDMFLVNNSAVIYKRWGIDYVLDGCSGSLEGWKNNKKVDTILEKRHGKFWKEIFEQSVTEEILNYHLVNKLVNSSKIVVEKRKKIEKEGERVRPLIRKINDQEYFVTVNSWATINGELEPVSLLRFIVNIKTKKATLKSNHRIIYAQHGEY